MTGSAVSLAYNVSSWNSFVENPEKLHFNDTITNIDTKYLKGSFADIFSAFSSNLFQVKKNT